MKSLSLFFLIFFTLTVPWAYPQADTLRIPSETPGVTLLQITDPAGPWSIQVIEWDRTLAPSLQLLPVKAAINDMEQVAALETTSDMIHRLTAHGYPVVGGVNADFFTRRLEPVNGMMSEGEWILFPAETKRASLSISADGKLWAGTPVVTAQACKESQCLSLLVNRNPESATHSILNPWFSDTLVSGSSVFRFRPVSDHRNASRWKGVLASLPVAGSNDDGSPWYLLPKDGMVFASAGTSNVQSGDTLEINISVNGPDFHPYGFIGGGPLMLKNGNITVDESAVQEGILESFLTTRHPRTAIAWNADQSKVWLLVVDGRQEHSVGMGLHELSDFFLRLGATDALNLDGGGSSALIMDHEVRNSPSDATGERRVTNALLLISNE